MIRYAFFLLLALFALETHAQPMVENCTNGIDDDGDGLIDCADVFQCGGMASCSSESANFNCSDGIDNDGDGKVDCADEECDCASVEICNNGLDDDGDGLVDCADTVGVGSNCSSFMGCERDCNNGIDDDGDGFVDYFDGDCSASPRQIDSLALVALYRSTDGDNWTKDDNWLIGPLDTWYGVTLKQGTVSSLRLGKNGLSGELPIEINSLKEIHSFDFSDNDIHTIPPGFLDNSPQASGWMGGTQLTFEDLLTQSRYFAKLYDQQLVGKDTTVILEKGESYTIRLHIDPEITTSQYVWFKNKVAFDTTAVNYYTIADVIGDNAGTYTCEVTNPESIINLTLHSHPTIIQVQDDRQPQTLTFDSIANRTYGDSSFVLRASTSANLPVRYQITEGEGMVITLKDSTVTIVGTGPAAIAALQDGNEEYLPATAVTHRFAINKLSQKITFTKLNSAWVGDILTLAASSNASLPVSFSVNGPARLEADRLFLTGEGQVTVTATQAGNEAYLPAEDAVQTIMVKPPLYSLSGQVFQGEGIPYTGVAAAVLYPSYGLMRRGDFRQQLLGEQGNYRFDSLKAGRYVFKVSVRSEKYISTYWGGHYLIIDAGSIPIQRDTIIDVTLLSAPEQYEGTAIIRGRLISNSTNGRTSQADDSFAEISVFLRDTQTGELVAFAVTNEVGEFEFTNLPEGEYAFVADYEGLATGENTVRVSNNQETVITVMVADEITVVREEAVITAIDKNDVSAPIQIFPNPVIDQLRIKATDPLWVGATVRLQNVLGTTVNETVIRHSLTSLNMSNQRAGIYLLTVKQGSTLKTHRVVKW